MPTTARLSPPSCPAPGAAPEPSLFVHVRTTLPRRPLPSNSTRQPIVTERLILRPPTMLDLSAIHELRTEPEVMRWTAAGQPDKDMDETRAKLELSLPPRDEATFNFAICLRETGEVIGMGGCHLWRGALGWPEVGYMIRREFWGRGLGTEFLRGWLRAWEGLEREEVEMDVDERTVTGMGQRMEEEGGGHGELVREQLLAVTAVGNDKSRGVLEKGGFEWFTTWLTEDLTTGSGPKNLIELPTYRHLHGSKKWT